MDGEDAVCDEDERGEAVFEQLPMMPTREMRGQVKESQEVWDGIQRAAKEKEAREEARRNAERNKGSKQAAVQCEPVNITKEEAQKVVENFAAVLRDCQEAQKAMEDCKSEADCARALLGLTMCMAKIICPLQHSAVAKKSHVQGGWGEQQGGVQCQAREIIGEHDGVRHDGERAVWDGKDGAPGRFFEAQMIPNGRDVQMLLARNNRCMCSHLPSMMV